MIKFQDQTVEDAAVLQRLVGDTPVGDTANRTAKRDGKAVDLTVTIGNLDDAVRRIAASLEDRLGVVIRPLKTEESREYGLDPCQGVAIKSEDADGLLGKVGFEKYDVIVDVNNIPVQGVEGFVALIKSLPPHQQALLKALDHHTGQNGYVQVTIG